MPAGKPAPAAKRSTEARARHGGAALDGLEVSLDDAQKALTELRRDLSIGGRDLVKDVDTAIKNARRDLRRSREAIQSDLSDLGEALTPRRTGHRQQPTTAKRKTRAQVPASKR